MTGFASRRPHILCAIARAASLSAASSRIRNSQAVLDDSVENPSLVIAFWMALASGSRMPSLSAMVIDTSNFIVSVSALFSIRVAVLVR